MMHINAGKHRRIRYMTMSCCIRCGTNITDGKATIIQQKRWKMTKNVLFLFIIFFIFIISIFYYNDVKIFYSYLMASIGSS